MNTSPPKNNRPLWRILVNVLTNYAGKFVLLGTWFFLTPFILRQIGASAYGVWILAGSFVSYGSLFDLGITGAITKYVSEFHGKDNYEQAHDLVATTLWIYTILGLIVILISGVLAPLFPVFFNLPASEGGIASQIVFLSGIGLGISLPGGTTIAVLRGLQRFDLVNVLSITGMLLYALMVVIVLRLGGGLIGMALANIPFTLLMQIPAIWLIYRIAPKLRFGWRGAKIKYIRSITSFSGAVFIIAIAEQLKTKLDEVIIGAFLPISAVTHYYFAHRLSEIPQLLTDQFTKVLMPLSSQLNSRNDRSGLLQLFLVSTRITAAIFVAIGCCVVILAKPFLAIWVGVEYTQYTGLVYFLTAASFVEILTWPAGAVLQGMSRHHVLAPIAIGSGILNLILSILLIRPFGLTGVALATLVPNMVEGIFLVLPYTLRELQIDGRTVIKEIILPIILPSILLASVLLLLRANVRIESIISLGCVGGIGILSYLIMYISLGKNLHERRIIRDLICTAYEAGTARFRL